MRYRVLFIMLVAVMVSIGHSGTNVAAAPPPGAPILFSLADLVKAAPLIVVGRVAEITPGREAGEGIAHLKFNDVRIEVEKHLKGEAKTSLVVELVDMTKRIVPELGPPYRVGERYVLFLQPGESPRFVTVGQGRYLLQGQQAHALNIGPVADRLEGKPEAEFIEEIVALVESES